jgi:hypothetical protein
MPHWFGRAHQHFCDWLQQKHVCGECHPWYYEYRRGEVRDGEIAEFRHHQSQAVAEGCFDDQELENVQTVFLRVPSFNLYFAFNDPRLSKLEHLRDDETV